MTCVRLRPATRHDREDVSAVVAGLSAESAYQRFLTGIGARPSRALIDAMLPEDDRGAALLGHLGERPVAHGLWARLGQSRSAEIALMVADDQQRAGIGTRLAEALFADLRSHGVERVEVYTGAGNVAIARMLARLAPHARPERDGAAVHYSFDVDAVAASAA